MTHNTGDENETSSDDDCPSCDGTGWADPNSEDDCPGCNGSGRKPR